MSATTKIQWTEKTWNPVIGCSRVSPGCENCYAERQAAHIVNMHGTGSQYARVVRYPTGVAPQGLRPLPRWNGEVAFLPDRLSEPLRRRKPTMWFVNSMSDLFHERLTNEQIAAVFGVMAACPQHTFQVLTKRAERMREWFAWVDGDQAMRSAHGPSALCAQAAEAKLGRRIFGMGPWPLPNVWLGVSAEDQRRADERIPLMLQCPAAVRWVSAEPLLGPIDLTSLGAAQGAWDEDTWSINALSGLTFCDGRNEPAEGAGLDWVVIGGESGPGARPCDVAWIRSLVRECKDAGAPAFVKQLGAEPVMEGSGGERFGWPCGFEVKGGRTRLLLKNRKGGDPAEWPEDLRVREWPT